MLPYVDSLAPDTRTAKSSIALSFCIIAFILQVQDGIKLTNKWLLGFMAYIILTSHFWWYMPFQMNDVNMPSFWKWEPMFQMTAMFLFAASVSSYKWQQDEIQKICEHITNVSIILSSYMILQYFGIDAFYAVKPSEQIGSVTAPNIAATLGQPTIAAPFLAMSFPFIFQNEFKKGAIAFGLAIVALLMSQSIVAQVAVIVIMIFGLTEIIHANRVVVLLVLIALAAGLMLIPNVRSAVKAESNGRFAVWSNIVSDIKSTPFQKKDGKNYSMFGVGLGTFDKVYHIKNDAHTDFHQAHNEYLEAWYSIGILGALLLLAVVFSYSIFAEGTFSLAIICLAFIAVFSFVWHLAVYQWFTALFIGLINKERNQ